MKGLSYNAEHSVYLAGQIAPDDYGAEPSRRLNFVCKNLFKLEGGKSHV
jgi:hypothetical protein